MAEQYRASIDADPALPPRYSLLAVAPMRPATGDDVRWEIHGTRWTPEHPAVQARSGSAQIRENGQIVTLGIGTAVGNPARADARPFIVWAEELWGAAGMPDPANYERLKGRAIRQLEATQSFHIAEELERGALTTLSPDSSNHFLAETALATTVTAAAVAADVALAAAEYAYMRASKGQRGMVYCTVDQLDHLATNGSIRREGNVWLTPMDNLVAADAGFLGSAPASTSRANGSSYLYVAPIVAYRLGEIITPATTHEAMEGSDRGINDLRVIAYRAVQLEWDVEASPAPVFAAQTTVDVSP